MSGLHKSRPSLPPAALGHRRQSTTTSSPRSRLNTRRRCVISYYTHPTLDHTTLSASNSSSVQQRLNNADSNNFFIGVNRPALGGTVPNSSTLSTRPAYTPFLPIIREGHAVNVCTRAHRFEVFTKCLRLAR